MYNKGETAEDIVTKWEAVSWSLFENMIQYIMKWKNQPYQGWIGPLFSQDYLFEFLLIYDKGETIEDIVTERGVVS